MRLAMLVCVSVLLIGGVAALLVTSGDSKKAEQHQKFGLGGTPPTKPADLEATPTKTTVALTWTASTDDDGIQSYQVSDNGRATRFLGPSAVFFTKDGLTCGKPHTFAVQARDPAGNISRPGVVHTFTSSCAPSGDVYVATTGNDGTCVAGDPDLPCAGLEKAYDIASAGDGISVGCGSYGRTDFSTSKSAGENVVFFPASADCVTLARLQFTDGGDYSTFQGFNIVDQEAAIWQGGTDVSHNVIFEDNQINVAKETDEATINLHIVDGWQFVNNDIGPTCCGIGANSPEGLRIGTPDGGIGNSVNVVIDGNTVTGTVRSCVYWPSGFGSCPGTNCGACHADGIHLWGFVDSVVSNNQIVGAEVQGIFIEPTNDSLNSNVTISGNTVSVVNGNAGIYVKANGTNTVSGTWSITGNHTGTSLLEVGSGFSGAISGTIFNVSGNTGVLLITDSGGNDAGCTGYPGTVTINYAFNTWTPGSGTTGCG